MSPYFQKRINNAPVRRRSHDSHSRWIYCAIVLSCVIAYGFVAAARNHFTAIELGYKSEELKKRRTELEQCQRKLALELARRTAPQKLDKRAEQQGLSLPTVRQTVAVRRTSATAD